MTCTYQKSRPLPAARRRVAGMVAGCRQGDRDAQRRLFDRYSPRVHALMARMTSDQDAADLVQQVFLQVFRKIHQFRGTARFETWLYRLAANEALQVRRRRRRQGRVVTLDGDVVDYRSPPRPATDSGDLLTEALGRMAPELRAIFELREVDQLSYRSIAATLRLSEGTVASRLNRARRELRRHLAQLGWNP